MLLTSCRYTPPPEEPLGSGNQLESTNYENTVLFLISCFQYILVAAVFSIGPPYRKPMWTNGWLLAAMVVLTGFNLVVLLGPPGWLSSGLTLMSLPLQGRYTLLSAAVLNVVLSIGFERWGVT